MHEIAKAIANLADAVDRLALAISKGEPLNFSLARGLDSIAKSIEGADAKTKGAIEKGVNDVLQFISDGHNR